MSATPVAACWHEVVASGDPGGLRALLAEDACFVLLPSSPGPAPGPHGLYPPAAPCVFTYSE